MDSSAVAADKTDGCHCQNPGVGVRLPEAVGRSALVSCWPAAAATGPLVSGYSSVPLLESNCLGGYWLLSGQWPVTPLFYPNPVEGGASHVMSQPTFSTCQGRETSKLIAARNSTRFAQSRSCFEFLVAERAVQRVLVSESIENLYTAKNSRPAGDYDDIASCIVLFTLARSSRHGAPYCAMHCVNDVTKMATDTPISDAPLNTI